jgi:hypothetical protein
LLHVVKEREARDSTGSSKLHTSIQLDTGGHQFKTEKRKEQTRSKPNTRLNFNHIRQTDRTRLECFEAACNRDLHLENLILVLLLKIDSISAVMIRQCI